MDQKGWERILWAPIRILAVFVGFIILTRFVFHDFIQHPFSASPDIPGEAVNLEIINGCVEK